MTFLTAHADAIFWAGVVVETIGFVWFLFDSYRCDVDLARWTLLFPPLAIYLAIRYPEECLKSFLVCVVGIGLITLGEKFAPPDSGGLERLPSVIESQLNP
ncbi:MAG TPA: hypothetical protein VHY09_11855 [Candidatus Methylacidiphilales bacterium]|jgi:hypothetical protein|nr:hypothetical protein [Candidatus Methylacidiphilales bacterium]